MLGKGKRRSPEKELRFGGSRFGVCDMLRPIQEPKWKSWVNVVLQERTLRGVRAISIRGRKFWILSVLIWADFATAQSNPAPVQYTIDTVAGNGQAGYDGDKELQTTFAALERQFDFR
jgi:hypothetical protein